MNFSRNMRAALVLAAVFASTFIIMFLVISGTQSSFSTPDTYLSAVQGMDITIGPKPNATDVALDTTITIDTFSAATLNDLQVTPEVPIANVAVEVSGPISYKQTFYPAQLLQPSTTYTVSVTIKNEQVSWSFTTTSQPYQPTTSFYLATYAPWIALATATTTTLLASSAIWRKKKQTNNPPPSHEETIAEARTPTYLEPIRILIVVRCRNYRGVGSVLAQKTFNSM
jgi:hypothetical protein